MKKQTKKQMQEFNKDVKEILEFYGAIKEDENIYSVNSDKVGKLKIVLDDEPSQVYTIYTRFEDAEKAAKYFKVNSNGKMNSHQFIPEPCLCFIDDLLDNYNQINGINLHEWCK